MGATKRLLDEIHQRTEEDSGIPMYVSPPKEVLNIDSLKAKADKWDSLYKSMSELYQRLDDEENPEGLDQVGELAARHLGFI